MVGMGNEGSNLAAFVKVAPMLVTPFDGCGKCLVAVRRLSRKSDATSSPERQGEDCVKAADAAGGHIIAWADDWEVSGAVNPLERPAFGPWLRGEMGPYAGIVSSAVDRIGRNLVDVLNTGYLMRDTGKLLITHRHGVWNLHDHTEENQFTFEALGAQMELRAIQKRNRDATERARNAYEKKNKVAYGYRIVRLTPKGKIHAIELDPHSAAVRREIAARLLADETGNVTPATEARRLNQARELSPLDYERTLYGREPQGARWRARGIIDMMTSEAALGYLMHAGRPVTREVADPESGQKRMEKVRIAPPLWDAATRAALVEKVRPKRTYHRAPKVGGQLMTARAVCGNCGTRLYLSGRTGDGSMRWGCTGRIQGLPQSAQCKPAPSIGVAKLDALVTAYFLEHFGDFKQYREIYDPGTGHAARRAELETDLTRMREDRQAGLYDRERDAAWFRTEYARLSQELDALESQPQREAGMVWVPTGKSIGDLWRQAPDDAARRELLESYHVKAVVYPRGAEMRVWIHHLDPVTEAEAREASWEAARQELAERSLVREQAEADNEPDAEEIAYLDEVQDAAREAEAQCQEPDAEDQAYQAEQDQAAEQAAQRGEPSLPAPDDEAEEGPRDQDEETARAAA